jgi:hypothetical protein
MARRSFSHIIIEKLRPLSSVLALLGRLQRRREDVKVAGHEDELGLMMARKH